jgi:O-antigen/teichoic acid export membrane protein
MVVTRIPTRKLLADSAILSVGSGGARLASLASSLGAAAILGASGFGDLGYLLVTVGTFASVGSLAVPAIVVREVAQQPQQLRETISAALLIVTTSTILTSVVGLFLLWFTGQTGIWNSWSEAPWVLLASLVLVMACAQAISAVAMSALTGGQAFKSWTAVSLGKALLIGSVTIVFAMTQSVPATLGAITVAEVISCLIAITVVRRMGVLGQAFERSLSVQDIRVKTKELIRQSIAPGLAGQSIAAANWLALTLLLSIAGSEALGIFIIALRIVTGASFIPMSVVDASLGKLHRDASQIQVPQQVKSMLIRASVSAMLTAMIVVIFAPAINLLGSDYASSVVTTQILAASLPLISLNALLGNIALSRQRMRLWASSDVILAATLIAAAIYLVPLYEVEGLSISLISAYAVSVLVLILFLRKVIQVSEH